MQDNTYVTGGFILQLFQSWQRGRRWLKTGDQNVIGIAGSAAVPCMQVGFWEVRHSFPFYKFFLIIVAVLLNAWHLRGFQFNNLGFSLRYEALAICCRWYRSSSISSWGISEVLGWYSSAVMLKFSRSHQPSCFCYWMLTIPFGSMWEVIVLTIL
jgi:hypothetical protein